MIRELHVRNLALIEELSLDFEGGFTAFTGETGAGKSILVGAIGLLLGERASSDLVRSGAEEADVSGVFEIGGARPALEPLLSELSIEADEGTLVVRRRISKSDRNRIHVNQTPLSLGSLKRLGDALVDFHGQHEHQSLLNEQTHGTIIDGLPEVRPLRDRYNEAYGTYCSARDQLDTHTARARALAERKDLLEFQFRELKTLGLKPGEEEELEAELALLSSAAERSTCVSEMLVLLTDEHDSLPKRISQVRRRLEHLEKFDPQAGPWLADVANTLSVFSELERFCAEYLDRMSEGADPARIEAINSRLAKIQRLRKKHNADIAQLIERQDRLEQDLLSIQNVDADRALLERNLESALKACTQAGTRLSAARTRACLDFDARVTSQMETLGFAGGHWKTALDKKRGPEENGLEDLRFLVQTNPGEPYLPLAKTASGGEISRLMLAIKSIIAERDRIPILVFDEIDTGIGGVLAGEVANALFALSRTHQVFCISHLHQIASVADHHFMVYKESSGDRTVTRVKALGPQEKVDEIARMLGGNTEISRKHARELLKRKYP